jgi:hypothetical protein
VAAPNDGHFSLTVYMANPEHVPLHQKRTVHFQVITMGAALLSPAQGARFTSSDILVGYSPFGEAPAGSSVRVGIDGREAVDADLDGSFMLRGVSNGVHSVSVRLVDTSGETLGESGQVSVVVRSALTRRTLLGRSRRSQLLSAPRLGGNATLSSERVQY